MPLKLVTKKCYYFWSCTRLVTVLLKIKCSHIGHLVEVENTTETEMSSFDEIFIIGCTGNWQNVSFHYHQCCKFHQKEILSVWVSSRNWWNDHQSNKSVTLTAFHTTCDDKAVVLTTFHLDVFSLQYIINVLWYNSVYNSVLKIYWFFIPSSLRPNSSSHVFNEAVNELIKISSCLLHDWMFYLQSLSIQEFNYILSLLSSSATRWARHGFNLETTIRILWWTVKHLQPSLGSLCTQYISWNIPTD